MRKLLLFFCFLLISNFSKSQNLISITPNQGTAGTTVLQALITSQNAFLQSASPSGIGNLYLQNSNCKTIPASNFNIVGEDSVYADFTIPANASNGSYNLSMFTYSGLNLSLPGAFSVVGGVDRALNSINPTQGNEGDTVTVTLAGQDLANIYSAFATSLQLQKNTTTFTAFNVQIIDPNTLQANFYLRPFSPSGTYNVNLSSTSLGCYVLTSAFTLNSQPRSISVSPTQWTAGTTIPALVTGQSTFFQSATPSGINYIKIQNANCKSYTGTSVNIIDDNNLTANFNIPSNAPNGSYDLIILNNLGGLFTNSSAVTITGGLTYSIQTFSPTTATAGSVLNATITGSNLQTMMSSGNVTVKLKQGSFIINGANLSFTNSTTATVDFNILPYANNGLYTLEITSTTGCYSLPQAITIQGGVPRGLTSVSPSIGNRGQTLTAVISGTYCFFMPGTTSGVIFRHTNSSYQFTVPTNGVLTTDSNHITLNFTIPAFAPAGFYNVSAGPSSDGQYFSLTPGFEIVGNVVGGRVFFDADSNGVFNLGDYYIQGKRVQLLPDSTITFSDQSGQYYLPVNNGFYDVRFLVDTDWRITTSPSSYAVTINNNDVTGLDFGTRPINNNYLLDVNITSGLPRCNRLVTYTMTVRNNSSVLANGLAYYVIDSTMIFSSAFPTPDYTNGDTLFWNYNNLYVNSQLAFTISVIMPPTAGLTVATHAYADIRDGSTIITSDTYSTRQTVICSYDPNDKLVEPPGEQQFNYVLNTLPLEYTIRFQNTGNDTAFRVMILDTISANMDLNSLTLISSSDPVEVYIHPNRVVEFRFDNILLPDSNVDEPGSHGFVKFRLSPINGINDPTLVENIAGIYFDLNSPVITNSVQTTYVTVIPTSISDVIEFKDKLMVVPNPFKGTSRLILSDAFKGSTLITITDIQGKIYSSFITTNTTVNLNCANWASGIYFVKAINQDNGISSSTKMVIQE